MGYATLSRFRNLTNINRDTISDNSLISDILPIADRLINRIISTKVTLEKIDGKIDGTNKDFRTAHKPICDTTLKNVTVADECDVTTGWTKGADGGDPSAAGALVHGSHSVSLSKSGSSTTSASFTKTITAVDGTGRRLKIAIYLKDHFELGKASALTIRIGSAADKYYQRVFRQEELRNGINEFDMDLLDMGTLGTPVITALVYLYIDFSTPASSDTITDGNVKMDYWRLEDIDSPDTSDVKVYYATQDDDTGFVEYGSAQAITSFQTQEGIITMTTAPTTTTAESGVFATYSYVSKTLDWELTNSAACYMAAHLCSFKIAGTAPDFQAITDVFARRDIAGAPDEWLRLCFSLLFVSVSHDKTGLGFRRIETNDPMEN